MAEVEVRNLTLAYGEMRALDAVSLDFADGGFFGLLGPSGSGKTTLLRCIAGFVFADAGTIRIGGAPVERVPVERREIGMMFQNYALFPNMSVAENVGFGLKVRRLPAAEVRRRTGEALDLVRLSDLGNRRPHQLSGGQRQRVALARAVVTRPRVLLLDEPLSALDKALRVDMQIELKRIQREVGITTIFVTHDQEEALSLSDRIGILHQGRLVQEGEPLDLYHRPANRFAATFLGEANLFDGTTEPGGLRLADGALLRWPGDAAPRGGATLSVRPEMIDLSTAPPPERDDCCVLEGRVRQVVFSGPTATCHVDAGGRSVTALMKSPELGGIRQGDTVWLTWPRSRAVVLTD